MVPDDVGPKFRPPEPRSQSIAPLLEESINLFDELRDAGGAQFPLLLLGRIEHNAGNEFRAQALYREALTGIRKTSNYQWDMLSQCLAGLGTLFNAHGQLDYAARLLGAAARCGERFSFPLFPSAAFHKQIASVRGKLGDAAFEVAFDEGTAMTDEQAVIYALKLLPADVESSQRSRIPTNL